MRVVKLAGLAALVLGAAGCVGPGPGGGFALPSGTLVSGPPPPPPIYAPRPRFYGRPPPPPCYVRPGPFGPEEVCRPDY